MSEPELELGDETPTALYRLYAANGTLLYVGISGDIKARFKQHSADKKWWPQVARKTLAWHMTRAGAEAAELAAIKNEKPAHNIVGASKPTARRKRRSDDGDSNWHGRPRHWPRDYWALIWWNSDRSDYQDRMGTLGIACRHQGTIDVFGDWRYEWGLQRDKGMGTPLIWYQTDLAPPDECRGGAYHDYTWSIHTDMTCAEPWENFTAAIAAAQERFLDALLTAGYCRSVHPGRAAAGFGFKDELDAQVAGAVLGELAWGRKDTADKTTLALLREASSKAA